MRTKFLVLVLSFTIFTITAQSVYNVEVDNVSYQDLSGSTSLNNGQLWDDPAFTIPLGFEFSLGTFAFNTIFIVEWGLGGDLSSSSNENGILPILIPIGQDIFSREDGNGNSTSPISYKLVGGTGNQILKIEWKNVGFLEDSTENDFMNLQLWLYENSNIIEYHYGPNVINNPDESFEGESGPYVSLFTSYNMDTDELEDNAYVISGNPTSPTVLVYQPGDEAEGLLLEGTIPDGTVYRFTPEELSINDFDNYTFTIYPNPSNTFLNIETTLTNYTIKIYDMLGKQVGDFTNDLKVIKTSTLNKALYIIKIESEEGSLIRKFIKN